MDALQRVNQKPEFDWESYYDGFASFLLPADRPMFWRCCCGETNATVVGEKARCVGCQVLAFSPQLLISPVL